MPSTPDNTDTPPRIAVIVVPGVGDDGLGDTAGTLAHTMVRQGYFDWAVHDEVTVTSQVSSDQPGGEDRSGKDAFIEPPYDRYAAPRRRMGRGRAQRPPGSRSQPRDESDLDVDIYEMNWADLSRFPTGLLRFVVALFGLVLQLGRTGIESTRHLDREPSTWRLSQLFMRGKMPTRRAAWARAVCEALSWWMAVVVVPVTALVVMLCLGLWVLSIVPAGFVQVLVLIVGAILSAVGFALIGRGVSGSGIQSQASLWVICAAIVAVLVGWLFGGAFGAPSAPVLMANTLLGVAAFPLRLVWLIALALSLTGIVVSWILLRSSRSESTSDGRSARWRAGSVTLLSVTASPFALAMVSGIVLASTSLVVAESMAGQSWRPYATELRCLKSPSDWKPQPCIAADDARLYRVEIERANRQQQAIQSGEGLPVEDLSRDQIKADAEQNADTIAKNADAAPEDWIKLIFVQILEPAALAALMLIAGFIYLTVRQLFLRAANLARLVPKRKLLGIAGAPTYLVSVLLGTIGRRRQASARRDEGIALTAWLSRLNGPSAAALITIVSTGAIAGTLAIWILGQSISDLPLLRKLLSDQGFDSGASVSVGLAALLVVARFLPLDPRSLGRSVGGGLERVRSALDILYDVLTYTREGGTAARFGVVSRYRALIAQVTQIDHADGRIGYDGVIFAAHSQGTVYTCATLFGDQARFPTIYPLTRGGEPRANAGLENTPTVSFLSFGSPVRQTYDRFFPDQYRCWYFDGSGSDAGRFAPLNDIWLNLYRPGDYVGRSVHRSPWNDASNEPDTTAHVARLPLGDAAAARDDLELIEACVNLPGAHTNYWGSPHVAAQLNYLIERAAGLEPVSPPLPLPSRRDLAAAEARAPR